MTRRATQEDLKRAPWNGLFAKYLEYFPLEVTVSLALQDGRPLFDTIGLRLEAAKGYLYLDINQVDGNLKILHLGTGKRGAPVLLSLPGDAWWCIELRAESTNVSRATDIDYFIFRRDLA